MPDGLRRMEPSGSPVRMDSLNSNRTSTRSRLSRERDYPVNLGGHDKIVLMQSLDLFGLQRNGNIAPTEADIRMMAFRRGRFPRQADRRQHLFAQDTGAHELT